jgi:UDP-GlcNAc:undecaprenyl-phosphate GlcNAc-1-phosphate transferase
VTVQRLLQRTHPFRGGTDHVSHRLVILGLSQRTTVWLLYGVSAGFGLLSLLSAQLTLWGALAVWLLALTWLVLVGRYLAGVRVSRAASAVEPPVIPFAQPVTRIETMLLHKRRLLEIVVDFCLICAAYVMAYLLRFEGTLTADLQRLVVKSLPVLLVLKLGCFAGCGLYRGVWRYAGLSDLLAVVKAVSLSSILTALALVYLWRFEGFSRSVLVIDWMLTLLGVGGSRVAGRLLDQWVRAAAEQQQVPVLIIGAGDAGERVLRHLAQVGAREQRVVGFLDDDTSKWGDQIHGIPVLGTRAHLAELLQRERIREVLIAIHDPPGDLLQHIQRCCEPLGVTWKVVTAGLVDAG